MLNFNRISNQQGQTNKQTNKRTNKWKSQHKANYTVQKQMHNINNICITRKMTTDTDITKNKQIDFITQLLLRIRYLLIRIMTTVIKIIN